MKVQSIEDLMITALTYELDFEEQVSQAASRMEEAASEPELKEAFGKTESKSKEYGKKLEEVFKALGKPVQRNENYIAKAMITEVQHMIENTDPGPVRDAALIVAANQQQQYRVASYGSLGHYADLLGNEEASKLLKQNVEDSKGGDEKFTSIGEKKVNQKALNQQPVAV